ncbi:MAG: pyruvate kinase [Limnochordia bacterium]|jgi:pyruvate kinase
MRKTKIVCTIGPASESLEVVRQLVRQGMNVARLNFSHGTLEEHLARLQNVREASRLEGRSVGVLLDIQGPKIRTGPMAAGPVELVTGQPIVVVPELIPGTTERMGIGYEKLPASVTEGSPILIDDGMVELRVEKVVGQEVHCRVVVGGKISARKGVSLPGVAVDLPPLGERDVEHLRFGVEHDVDFIAASFVRRGEHVEFIKETIAQLGGDIPVIAKIESDEGVRNIHEIIDAADGVMVARGDLGVQIPPEEVPLVQKQIIHLCNVAGKPVIIATQMLESMVRHARPTRAEVTDVAQAIFDGTDAVMLSGETAVGRYPAEAVSMMSRIASRVEKSLDYEKNLEMKRDFARTSVAEAISHATCEASLDLDLKAIISSTQSGSTARMVSKYRPRCPIIAVTPSEKVCRQLTLTWGVLPVVVPRTEHIDDMIDIGDQAALASGLVQIGDLTAITAGVKTGLPGSTNMLQIHEITG